MLKIAPDKNEMLFCPRCYHEAKRSEWATRYGILTCGSCLNKGGYVILPQSKAELEWALALNKVHGN